MLGMNASLMGTYVEYVADVLLRQLGYGAHYFSANPVRPARTVSFRLTPLTPCLL